MKVNEYKKKTILSYPYHLIHQLTFALLYRKNPFYIKGLINDLVS